jgi:hypothetical protein
VGGGGGEYAEWEVLLSAPALQFVMGPFCSLRPILQPATTACSNCIVLAWMP